MTGIAGLPEGTLERAIEAGRRAASSLSLLSDRPVTVDPRAMAAHLELPRLLDEGFMATPEVVSAEGGGFVHADLTAEDRGVFDRLLALRPAAGAEELAAEAQAWRLPVTPYRSTSAESGAVEWAAPCLRDERSAPLRRRLRVLDLTTMWAGPLATHLLAAIGAEVVTVEPSCRPDGLRGSPRHFDALAAGKVRVDLDLRVRADRARFEALVDRSDLVVESFSRRVMPNFGYHADELRRRNPQLVVVGIRAFGGEGPERDWVAYGPGVHATAGPSVDSLGCPTPASVAYADPLTGLAAVALAASVAGRAHEVPPLVEVTLAEQVVGLGPVDATRPAVDAGVHDPAFSRSFAGAVPPLLRIGSDV